MSDFDPTTSNMSETESRLRASLAKLQSAYKTFLIHSAEYSAFIEEITPLSDDATYQELLDAGRRFGGTLVDERDVISVLGGKEVRRGKEQVVRALERRLDWVNDNIKKVQHQIDLAETALIEGHDIGGDELPTVEISEEVDEDGNVLDSVIREKGGQVRKIDVKDVPDFVKLLQKVGKEGDKKIEAAKAGKDENKVLATSPKDDVAPITKAVEKEAVVPKEEVKEDIKKVGTSKTDLLDSTPLATATPSSLESPEKGAEKKVERIEEIVDQEERIEALKEANAAPTPPKQDKKHRDLSFSDSDESEVEEIGRIPPGWKHHNINDTDDEARLRREMLKYNVSEIGPIVAELNIEDGDEDGEEYEYDEEDYDYDDEDEEDEEYEDEHGRSTKRMVTDDLREEMARLQARIAAREAGTSTEGEKTAEKKPADGPVLQAQNAGPMQPMTPSIPALKSKPTASETPKSTESGKKSVRFNEELDISPAPPHVEPLPTPVSQQKPPHPANMPHLDPDEEDAIPFLVSLLEQSDAYKNKEIPGLDHLEGTELEPEAPIVRSRKPKGPSLFKKARHQNDTEPSSSSSAPSATTPPSQPSIMSSNLVERSIPIAPTPPQPKKSSIMSSTLVERSAPVTPTPPTPKAPSIMSSTLVERSAPVTPSAPTPPTKKKSKFAASKAAKSANPLLPPPEGHPLARFRSLSAIDATDPDPSEPSGPPQPLLSNTIVEHPPLKPSSPSASARVNEPDEFDVDIHRGEAAQKLVSLQSKIARQEGGVLNRGEREIVPLTEEEGGKKKVSKFREMMKGK